MQGGLISIRGTGENGCGEGFEGKNGVRRARRGWGLVEGGLKRRRDGDEQLAKICLLQREKEWRRGKISTKE